MLGTCTVQKQPSAAGKILERAHEPVWTQGLAGNSWDSLFT